ncbi:hypothetical protein, partial [Bilophila wadsworthia]|uniref:hypothetical protein n=1 Tax=Bilophila wadsworthia TaxID=35833 RepID=UPI003A88A86C
LRIAKGKKQHFASGIFAASSEIPYFLRKENLDPLPGTFLIAVYAAGHYSACNPPNGISFISTRRGWTTPFLSFPARSPLCPQHLPVRLI